MYEAVAVRARCCNRTAVFGGASCTVDTRRTDDVYLYKGCYLRLIAVSTSANDGGMTTLCAFEYSAAKCNTRKHFSFHSYVADTTPFAEVETAIWS